MIGKRKTIFDVLKEAEEDEVNDSDQTQDEAPSPEESGEDASGDDEYGGEDDFNIDTSLDDDTSADDGGSDSDISSDDSSSDTTSSGGTSGEVGEEEPIEANTDIFSSLSAEEQQIKIIELKKMFMNLYSSTDDILERINNTDTDESNLEVISRISMTLYSLRQYLNDYICKIFAQKSYIENDITFNRFLAILNSISVILEEVNKINQGKSEKGEKK